MAASSPTAAARRLRQIVATAAPPSSVGLLQPCGVSGQTLVELEGEAIGRFAAMKVVLLRMGERGVPLAAKAELETLFRQRSLEPVSVEAIEDIPKDTQVIVTTGMPVDAKVLAAAPKLKLVAVAFSGVDHIDVAACKARGITVVNVPGYSTDATAELAVGLVISHLRRLPACHQGIKDGQWPAPHQEDLQTKSVGIIGLGKIGLRLAELFKAFKVKSMKAYSLTQDPQFVALGGSYVDSLGGLFLDSDVICVCVPLTETSKNLVSEKLMQLLRPDSILVNVSRGAVVDEAALAKYLKDGRFRAALDVFDTEPLPKNSPLRQLPSETLLMTPHIGYQSEQSLARRLDATVKNILAYLAGQPINMVL